MKVTLYQIDAFTGKLFKGNPAAVCPLDEWLPDKLLQSIACENNLSETAFFVNNDGSYQLRWFTPTTEVDLCGHATLASAYVLYKYLNYTQDQVVFETKSGELQVSQNHPWIAMNFPVAQLNKEAPPLDLYHALGGVIAVEVYKDDDFLWVLESEDEVRNIRPDFRTLKQVPTRGVIVTAPGNDVDFVSRFFAPAVGVDEDPVTGSAHTMLIPYWAGKLGKKAMNARQVSKRGGELRCKLLNNRVEIAGQCQTYLTGTIDLNL